MGPQFLNGVLNGAKKISSMWTHNGFLRRPNPLLNLIHPQGRVAVLSAVMTRSGCVMGRQQILSVLWFTASLEQRHRMWSSRKMGMRTISWISTIRDF